MLGAVPVDDFFDTYVNELGQRGLQQEALPQANPALNGALAAPIDVATLRFRLHWAALGVTGSHGLIPQAVSWTRCWSTSPTPARSR